MKVESAIEKLKRLAREAKERGNGQAAKPLDTEAIKEALQELPAPVMETVTGVPYTENQLTAIKYATDGVSFCMTGAAGTGKTTTTRGIVQQLIISNKIPQLSITHRYLQSGAPGIVGCAFTNKAVQNIKRVMPKDLQHNFITIHKLLEFEPVYYEVYDAEKGRMVTKMEFKPARSQMNPLPESMRVLILEESTMIGIDLWNQLFDALPIGGKLQIILIGDIQQLPPVFGKSIFIHAMQSGIKVVELNKVHRQALESPILALAHRILSGKIIPSVELDKWNLTHETGKLTVFPWKKELEAFMACKQFAGRFMSNAMENGGYDPYEDAILCPYNKSDFGCIEINNYIASYMAKSAKWNPEGHLVHEVLGGVNTKYFRIGDKVLWNKTEHRITDIKVNARYVEKDPQLPSQTMDYWGNETDEHAKDVMLAMLEGGEVAEAHNAKIDLLLASFSEMMGDDETKATSRQCSHIITVESAEFGEYKIETSGDLGNLDLAYAITVHKSQGSEYRRVYFVSHKSMATMLFRELIYTAVTRAKEELVIICTPSLFVQGINSQRLPGKTLEEKILAFNRYLETSKVSSTELPRGIALLIKEAA
jgi:exodeoxyribonuclease V alpha subunit